jgi:hypothetical protein
MFPIFIRRANVGLAGHVLNPIVAADRVLGRSFAVRALMGSRC